MKTVTLEIIGLKKSFEGVPALIDISFSAKKETVTLITGENGAGKTTLFNLLTGLESADRGKILFEGTDICGFSPLDRSRAGIVRLFQQPRIFQNLTVWENLACAIPESKVSKVKGLLNRVSPDRNNQKLQTMGRELLGKFELGELMNRKAGDLSYGQQKLLSFSLLAVNGAKLVLLDEPFAGLNPLMINLMKAFILEMKQQGITFLIIEHNVNQALTIANEHFVLMGGKLNLVEARLDA